MPGPGDFTATEMAKVKKKIKQIFPEISEEYNNIQIAQEVLGRQTAQISQIKREERCIGATITYQLDCTDSIQECEAVDIQGCDWDADENESASIDIEVDDCVSDKFAIEESECQNNHIKYAEKFAYRLGTGLAKVEEKLAQKSGAFTDSIARVPVTETEHGTINGTAIEFDEADWNLELISKMLFDAKQNSIDRPYGLSTGLLWVDQNLNKRKGAGCCTFDSPNGGIDIAYDLRFSQLKSVVGGDQIYYVDPRYFAFWAYNFETSNNFVSKGHSDLSAMRIKLPRLTYGRGRAPIYADLYRKRVCNNTLAGWRDKFILKVPFGFFQAPDICGDGNTGVLKFGVTAGV